MPLHEKMDYVEFPARDLNAAKRFFEEVFGWTFTDYGDSYVAFDYQGLEGGFFASEAVAVAAGQDGGAGGGGALVVFYSEDLEATRSKIVAAGGTVVRETFDFPGGRRFHFADPNGNEYAVWSAVAAG